MSDSGKTLNNLLNRRSLAPETYVESLKHGGVLKCDCNNAIDLHVWSFVQPIGQFLFLLRNADGDVCCGAGDSVSRLAPHKQISQ